MSLRRNSLLFSVLLLVSVSAFVDELDDTFMETRQDDDIWLIKLTNRQLGGRLKATCTIYHQGRRRPRSLLLFCMDLNPLSQSASVTSTPVPLSVRSGLLDSGVKPSMMFYAPWCTFCKQLDPVWHQIGSELRSLGSPVKVGKSDATTSTGLSKEFRVRGFPAIIMLKKDVKYNYAGPRTKAGILDFAERLGGPLVRSLNSLQLFQHAMNRHDVMFVYVGATSQLKGNYMSAAEELIVHTYFFSCSRDVLPKAVSIPSLPAVVVFKDGTYLTFDEKLDRDLKSWINRERFPNYFKIDSYTLYAMGDSGKLVLLALVDDKRPCEDSLRYKHLVEKVSADYKDVYSRDLYFGFMEGADYIQGLVMDKVIVPSFIVVNLSNDGYFLPSGALETERHLLDFLDGVLNGSIQCQGGNGISQRATRFLFDIRAMLMSVFNQAPLLCCFLVGFPLAIVVAFFYLCCKNRRTSDDDDDDDVAPSLQRYKKLTTKKSD